MRILAIFFAIGIALLIGVWVVGDGMSSAGMNREGDEQWPLRLGTLAELESRLPRREPNDAARRLMELSRAVDITFEKGGNPTSPLRTAIGEYVSAHHMRADRTIAAPPAEVASHLASHETQLDALRDHLLRNDLTWDLDVSKGFAAPIPNLLAHMHIARLLTARALVRARENDARAWLDLQAVSRLARSLESRPELITQMISLAIARMVHGAAWKLPAADAPWLAELQAVDHRRLLMAGIQYDTWLTWKHGEDEVKGLKAEIGKPYVRWSVVDMTRRQRRTAEEIASVTACATDTAAIMRKRFESMPRWNIIGQLATPNLDTIWERVFRGIAEREGSANAMRIVRGAPIVTTSRCSDGAWSREGERLRFNLALPSSPSDKPMPLTLTVGTPASSPAE